MTPSNGLRLKPTAQRTNTRVVKLSREYLIKFVIFVTVRQKVKELIEFIKDDEKLREERKKAKKNRDKYVGMSGLSSSLHYGKSSAVSSNTCSTPRGVGAQLLMLLF